MSDNIQKLEELWTTKQADYALLEASNGSYSIIKLSTNSGLIIEDNETYAEAIQNMLLMGNRRFTISEYKKHFDMMDE